MSDWRPRSRLGPLATRHEMAPKLGFLLVVGGAMLWLVPFLWMFVASVRPQAFGGPGMASILPDAAPTMANFAEAWASADFPRYYLNTAIIASAQGIGFAIPVNMAKEIAPQLQEKGHVTRGWFGVSIQEMTPELAKSFGMKEKKGALVSEVISGSPAEKAGIEQGDVIMEFDGKAVADSQDLPRMVASTPVGKSVNIKLWRNEKALDRQVKVGEMEETVEITKTPAHDKALGISVQNLTPAMAKRLRLKSETGVLVTRVEPGSPAADAGIQTGDIIREVNRKAVKNVDDLVQKLEQTKDQNNILLLVQRGQNNLFAAVKPK